MGRLGGFLMNFIYSNLLPLDGYSADQIITERFRYEFQNSEKVEIAVGYVSEASLTELGNLVSLCNTKNIVLVIGMHYIEGISERTYRKAMELNKQWCATGIGEIRIVRAFKFHGKLYAFYRNGIPISAMIGSANLSAIKLEASNRRQYEIMGITTDLRECTEISTFIMRLKTDPCSINIDDAANMPIIRESNTSLTGIDTVFRIPMAEVEIYEGHKTATSFMLPIKVPAYNDRFMDDNKHYTKSNLNVCYAAPRNARKPRDWYETQFTVSKDIVLLEGYPKKNQPFYVVTDDGYTFKAHTTSDHNKQFSAVAMN